MVNTVYDVFRRFPIARVVEHVDSSERSQAIALLPKIPENGIIVADRGYPGYEFFLTLLQKYNGYFLVRGSSTVSFKAVKKFLQSNKNEAIISIHPTRLYLDKCSPDQKKNAKLIQLRVIRCTNSQGEISVLFTNIMDMKKIPKQEIIDLYHKRWEVESYYRDEKIYVDIVKFHATKPNEIRQELFAAVVMSVLTRVLIMVSNESMDNDRIRPRFKNAILALSNEAAILLPHNPGKAFSIFLELIEEVKRVKHYGHKKKRKSQPRVCKQAINRWSRNRISKILECSKCKS